MQGQIPTTREYQYYPLAADEIRLLRFTDNTGLNLTIQSHSIESIVPHYIALSYRWSEPAERSITIENRSFQVGRNLFEALTSLAGQVRAEDCLLWVDAICINQKDTVERNAQVKMMKRIYELSERVFSWLGMPDNVEDTKLAIDLMGRIRFSLETAWQNGGGDLAAVQNLASADHFAFPTDKAGQLAKAWTEIHKTFNSPYWTRTWIYQEATAPVSIDFFVGKFHFSGLDIYPVFFFATAFKELTSDHRALLISISNGCSAYQMYQARLSRSLRTPRRLLDLLYEIKSTEASDPRDKVYACLGHASDAGNMSQIPIDYKRPVTDVYIDVVRFALENWQVSPLEFLSFVYTQSSESISSRLQIKLDPEMPSWVPDWRQRTHGNRVTASNVGGTSLYNPCPGTTAEIRIDGHEMHIKGIISMKFEITFVTRLMWQSYSPSSFKLITSMFFEAGGMAKGTEDHKAEVADVLGRTAVLDRSYISDPAVDSDNGHRWLRKYVRGGNVDWALANADSAILSVDDQVKQDSQYERMQASLLGRRLGWMGSDQDGCCGSFPAATQIGDRIAIFFGGKSLYVIRPTLRNGDQVFQFIGECYVNGQMDGKLFDDCRCEGVPEQVIRLV